MSHQSGPRLRPQEMIREAELTKQKFLVVEGPTDRNFYSRWLTGNVGQGLSGQEVIVVAVETIDLPAEDLLQIGLNDGNRSRVLLFASLAADSAADIRFIADRDCGHNVSDFKMHGLLWTDYPALESYAFTGQILGILNAHFLGERLPSGDVLVRDLSKVLLELFTVRMHNEHLPTPNLAKGFPKNSKKPSDFDVSKTVDSSIGAASVTYVRPQFVDPREIVYGHDLAEILMHLYGNAIKTQAGYSRSEALENAMRAVLLIEKSIGSEPLFVELGSWAVGAADVVELAA